MAKLVAWESLIGWFACVNFVVRYKVCLVAIVTYFKVIMKEKLRGTFVERFWVGQ